MFWLEVRDADVTMGDVVAQVEALTRLAEELDGRLVAAEVGGLAGIAAIHERLRAVLDGVSLADLERMTRQVAALHDELVEAARRIAAIRELKALFERLP